MLTSDGKDHATKAVVVTNNKGGVAKTTSCASLAFLLGKQDKKVLVIDADMQGNLTKIFEHSRGERRGLADYLNDFHDRFKKQNPTSPDVTEYIRPSYYKNVDVICGDVRLSGSVEDFVKTVTAEYDNPMLYLIDDIKNLNIYDYIFIDTAPSMSIIVSNFILASDWALVPTDVDVQGIEGATKVASFIKMRMAKKTPTPIAKLAGVFFTRVDQRTSMGKNLSAFKTEIFDPLGIKSFESFIPQSADVPTAIANQKPVVDMYPVAKASKKYAALLEEVVTIIG